LKKIQKFYIGGNEIGNLDFVGPDSWTGGLFLALRVSTTIQNANYLIIVPPSAQLGPSCQV